MLSVLAGSLAATALERALSLEPNFVAVRGAACRDGRTGDLHPAQLASLVKLVRTGAPSGALRVQQ
jgi:hypothetical protein